MGLASSGTAPAVVATPATATCREQLQLHETDELHGEANSRSASQEVPRL